MTKDKFIECHERIKPFIHNTPVIKSELIDKLVGAKIYFKCDNFQKMGAFKMRGATSASASTTACTNQAIQFYKDTQPNSCAQWKLNDPVYSNGYKTLELTVLSSTFSSSGEYTLKIPSNTLDSLDFTKKAEEYTKSVTLAP